MKGKEKEFAGYLKKSAGTTKGKAKADPVEKPPVAAKKVKKDDIPDVKKETIAAKVDKKKTNSTSREINVKKEVEDDGSPKSFSTSLNGKPLQILAVGRHSPTWAQNNDGVFVSGNKSREFMPIQGTPHLLSPNDFKQFAEKIRSDEAYKGVEEFKFGSFLALDDKKSQKTLKNLEQLEASGLITIVGDRATKKIVVNFDENGKIRKASDVEVKKATDRAKAFAAREKQVEMLEEEHGALSLSKTELTNIRKRETELAQDVQKIEDKLYDRKNTKMATEAEYIKKAEDWAKSQGFKNDGNGVNGFSAKQAAKHDIAHPATHDLVGLNSAGIHSYFGGLKTASGKKSLLGEEAIVNVMEHLSRGDTLESSVMSGTRVARMLSRDSTPQEKAYVRSPKFLQDLNALAEKALRADNFGTITKVIRESNWESGTVTSAGNV
jgi:hypothetical protein